MGDTKCAKNLASEFRGFNLAGGKNLVGYIDQHRAERYKTIGDALEWYKGRLKLPNLDKVLPLPPAALPNWDGNKKSLIDAAKAVTPSPKPGAPSGAALQGREHIAGGYGVT
jgi:hypothetical protein